MDLNSEFVLRQNRVCEGSSSPPNVTQEDAPPAAEGTTRKRRRTGKFKGALTGGGGLQRGASSGVLQELWAERRQTCGRRKPTKEERRIMFQRAADIFQFRLQSNREHYMENIHYWIGAGGA